MSWRTKYPDSVVKGYKMNLQHALGTKVPSAILNFLFKFTVGRKVWRLVKKKKKLDVVYCLISVPHAWIFFFVTQSLQMCDGMSS